MRDYRYKITQFGEYVFNNLISSTITSSAKINIVDAIGNGSYDLHEYNENKYEVQEYTIRWILDIDKFRKREDIAKYKTWMKRQFANKDRLWAWDIDGKPVWTWGRIKKITYQESDGYSGRNLEYEAILINPSGVWYKADPYNTFIEDLVKKTCRECDCQMWDCSVHCFEEVCTEIDDCGLYDTRYEVCGLVTGNSITIPFTYDTNIGTSVYFNGIECLSYTIIGNTLTLNGVTDFPPASPTLVSFSGLPNGELSNQLSATYGVTFSSLSGYPAVWMQSVPSWAGSAGLGGYPSTGGATNWSGIKMVFNPLASSVSITGDPDVTSTNQIYFKAYDINGNLLYQSQHIDNGGSFTYTSSSNNIARVEVYDNTPTSSESTAFYGLYIGRINQSSCITIFYKNAGEVVATTGQACGCKEGNKCCEPCCKHAKGQLSLCDYDGRDTAMQKCGIPAVYYDCSEGYYRFGDASIKGSCYIPKYTKSKTWIKLCSAGDLATNDVKLRLYGSWINPEFNINGHFVKITGSYNGEIIIDSSNNTIMYKGIGCCDEWANIIDDVVSGDMTIPMIELRPDLNGLGYIAGYQNGAKYCLKINSITY